MFQRRFGLLFLVPLCVLAVGANAFAADCRAKINLTVGPAGLNLDVSGTAEKRARGTRETFSVNMDAGVAQGFVAPGTTFAVYVGPAGAVPGNLAGTITINALGVGGLDLSNANGVALPTGVSPVCSIGSVEIRNGAGGVVLSGSF